MSNPFKDDRIFYALTKQVQEEVERGSIPRQLVPTWFAPSGEYIVADSEAAVMLAMDVSSHQHQANDLVSMGVITPSGDEIQGPTPTPQVEAVSSSFIQMGATSLTRVAQRSHAAVPATAVTDHNPPVASSIQAVTPATQAVTSTNALASRLPLVVKAWLDTTFPSNRADLKTFIEQMGNKSFYAIHALHKELEKVMDSLGIQGGKVSEEKSTSDQQSYQGINFTVNYQQLLMWVGTIGKGWKMTVGTIGNHTTTWRKLLDAEDRLRRQLIQMRTVLVTSDPPMPAYERDLKMNEVYQLEAHLQRITEFNQAKCVHSWYLMVRY